MRGNITRRGKSSWRIKFDVGTDADWQAQNPIRDRQGHQEPSADRTSEAAYRVGRGSYVARTVETVSPYCRSLDREHRANLARSPSPLERHNTLLRAHIIPGLGAIELQKRDGTAIDKFYASRREMGLASLTLRHIHSLLVSNLRVCRQGKEAHSLTPPADIQTKPKAKRRDKRSKCWTRPSLRLCSII